MSRIEKLPAPPSARLGELATRRVLLGVFWVGLYLALALLPLGVVLIGPMPPGRDFLTEFSVALGFVGLSMLGLQFAITARFRRVEAPYGLDIVLQFHRRISFVALALILAHPLILLYSSAEFRAMIARPLEAPPRAWFAVLSLACLLALTALSVWRQCLGLSYEQWRTTHGVLAVLAVFSALAHILGVGHYLDAPWKQALWAGGEFAVIGLLVYVRVAKPLRMGYYPFRVTEVRPERGGAHTLVLRPDGHAGLTFTPGQFAWIKVGRSPFSRFEHPFSLSDSARGGTLEFTVKPLGDFTRTVGDIPPGTRVYVDGPYGVFTAFHQPAPGYVYVAGGIGITPIMSMLRTHADEGDGRPHLLIYANRDWESVTFREEIDALRTRLDLTVVHVLEQPDPDVPTEVGFVTAAVLDRHLPADRGEREVFVCGPPRMLEAVTAALLAVGVPRDDVHSELFAFA